MDRNKIKQEAKDAIKGKVFYLFVIMIIMSTVAGATVGIIAPILAFGLFIIIGDILKGKDIDFNHFVTPFKDLNHAVNLIIVSLVYGLIVAVGLVLFVVPGIIFALMYSQALYIMMEEKDLSFMDALKKSKELMKGHKTEFFMFNLSFIGHYILVLLTLGLWSIYFLPYLQVATINYYRHLRGVDNNIIINS